MTPEELKSRNFESELIFATSRSSGPGGQNVNKVSSKVELRFDLAKTLLLSEEEKQIVFRKLKNKINKDNELILVSQAERSQLMNKSAVSEKFYTLLSAALTKPRKRTATRPSLSSKLKRLEGKKYRGFIKKLRKGSPDQSE
jgi:ribosome-associated protein